MSQYLNTVDYFNADKKTICIARITMNRKRWSTNIGKKNGSRNHLLFIQLEYDE